MQDKNFNIPTGEVRKSPPRAPLANANEKGVVRQLKITSKTPDL